VLPAQGGLLSRLDGQRVGGKHHDLRVAGGRRAHGDNGSLSGGAAGARLPYRVYVVVVVGDTETEPEAAGLTVPTPRSGC